jgi:hypothetical protein
LAAGASLPDPQKLFSAMLSGKSRAVDVGKHDKLNEAALKTIIRAGAAHNLAKAKRARLSKM